MIQAPPVFAASARRAAEPPQRGSRQCAGSRSLRRPGRATPYGDAADTLRPAGIAEHASVEPVRLKRLLAIGCEILCREASAAIAESPCVVDVAYMPKSLHDIGEGPMSSRLQTTIELSLASRTAEAWPDAIVLLYGLCNNGICGLHAPVPIVVPRAHDCITLLLGSRARYDEYFQGNPGTFYRSPGWIERDSNPDSNPASVTSRLGITRDYAKLAKKYGEDNARYLMATMGDWFKHYRRLCLIDSGVGPGVAYRTICQNQAKENDWTYEEIAGDVVLIRKLLCGEWDEQDFLILQPGQKIAASHDACVICAEGFSP